MSILARTDAGGRETIQAVGQNRVYLSIYPSDNRQTRGRCIVLSRVAACQTTPIYTAGSQVDPHSRNRQNIRGLFPLKSSSSRRRGDSESATENALISSSIPSRTGTCAGGQARASLGGRRSRVMSRVEKLFA